MSDITKVLLDWNGILPIVSVPFDEYGEIDVLSFTKTIDYIEKTSAFGMVLYGIASEFYKLSDEEKIKLTKLYLEKKTSAKKLVSVTAHATKIAVRQAKLYEDMGSDGLMLLPPFFLAPQKQEIMKHIESVLESVSIPVLLQIASGEIGISYTTEELMTLHQKYPHLLFKIEGNPAPIELVKALVKLSTDIKIYNGYAGIFMIEMLEVGCSGIMPGCSFIEIYTDIYNLFVQNKKDEAYMLHKKLSDYILPWMSHCEYIIQVEKNILNRRGVIATDYCRKPSFNLDDKDYEDISKLLNNFY